jgi:hypothetical protein
MSVKGHKHRRHQPQGNTGTELRDPEDRPLIVGGIRGSASTSIISTIYEKLVDVWTEVA